MKSFKLISLAITMLLLGLKSYCQLDTIKKTDSSKPVLIRLGRPATENNQPLFILDGKPIDSKEFQNIKPETIESVTVLKDSASRFFCHRSNNGVIIITTKKISKRELRKMKKKE